MIDTDYNVEVKDIVNVSTVEGDEHVGGSAYLTHKMALPTYKIWAHGVITYQRACELIKAKASGNDYKTLCNKTHLWYVDDGDYFKIVYDNELLIEIRRHGWLIHAPSYRDILYPGYVNRITAFTGVCVYKRVIRGGVKIIEYGSPRYKSFVNIHGFSYIHATRNCKRTPKDNLGRNRDTIFVDYSFADKNPFSYYMGLSNLEPHTDINNRKESRLSWYRGTDHNGRIRAHFGSPSKISHFIQDVIKGYVTEYLSSVVNRNTSYLSDQSAFKEFCTYETYRYNFHSAFAQASYSPSTRTNRYTVQDVLPAFHTALPHQHGYLSSPSLYKIDILDTIQRFAYERPHNPKMGHHKLVGSLGGCTSLTQSIFAMRGFKFIPHLSRELELFNREHLERLSAQLHDGDPLFQWHRDIIDDEQCSNLDQLMPKGLDKLSFTSHDIKSTNYNWYSRDRLQQSAHVLTPYMLNNFSLREPFIRSFFQHMCCLSSGGPEKTPYSASDIASMYSSTNELLKSSYVHQTGSFNGRYHHLSDAQVDDTRRGYGHFSTRDPLVSLQSDLVEAVARNDVYIHEMPGGFQNTPWVPYNNQTNPYPRIIFFVMLDEYINNILYDKDTLMDMLSKEWGSIDVTSAAGIHDQVTKGAMPISYDIMYSFLNKRFGMFMQILGSDKLYARQNDIPIRNIYGGVDLMQHGANSRDPGNSNYGYHYSSEPLRDHMFPPFNIESEERTMVNRAVCEPEFVKSYRDGDIPRSAVER